MCDDDTDGQCWRCRKDSENEMLKIDPCANGKIHTRECPFVDRSFEPNPQFNTRKVLDSRDGTPYVYYEHWDGFDRRYNAQFCVLIGRKKDVFECLNIGERCACSYYVSQYRKMADALRSNGLGEGFCDDVMLHEWFEMKDHCPSIDEFVKIFKVQNGISGV